jgi:hypothetical protein
MRFAGMLLGAAPLALAVTCVTGTAAAADVGKTKTSATGKGITGGALLGAELVCGVEAVAGVKSPWAYLGGGVLGAAAGGVGGYFVEQHASPRASLLMLAGGMTLVIPTIVGVLSATAYRPPADYLTDRPPADEPIANPPQPDLASPSAPAATPAPAPAPATAPTESNPATPPTTVPPAAAPAPTPPASPSGPASGAGPSSQLPRVRHHLATRERLLPPLVLTPPALVALTPGAVALRVPAVEIQNTYTRAEVAMYGVKQTTEVHIPVVNVVF